MIREYATEDMSVGQRRDR